MWMLCVQLPRSRAHTAKMPRTDSVRNPFSLLFYEFALVRRRVSIARFQGQRGGSRVIFSAASKLATLPGIRRALPSGRKRAAETAPEGCPQPRQGPCCPEAQLRPADPPTRATKQGCPQHPKPRPTNKQARRRRRPTASATRRAPPRPRPSRALVFGEPGRGEAREPSRTGSHILETDDRRVVGNRATKKRFIKERRLLVERGGDDAEAPKGGVPLPDCLKDHHRRRPRTRLPYPRTSRSACASSSSPTPGPARSGT